MLEAQLNQVADGAKDLAPTSILPKFSQHLLRSSEEGPGTLKPGNLSSGLRSTLGRLSASASGQERLLEERMNPTEELCAVAARSSLFGEGDSSDCAPPLPPLTPLSQFSSSVVFDSATP